MFHCGIFVNRQVSQVLQLIDILDICNLILQSFICFCLQFIIKTVTGFYYMMFRQTFYLLTVGIKNCPFCFGCFLESLSEIIQNNFNGFSFD